MKISSSDHNYCDMFIFAAQCDDDMDIYSSSGRYGDTALHYDNDYQLL